MLNYHQREHMADLATIPAERRCWSGWCLLPERKWCCSPSPCPYDVTLADRLRTKMPCCGRDASRPDASHTSGSHYAGCTPARRELMRSIAAHWLDLGGEA